MSFKFTGQRLLSGLFEPEGIYLTAPFEGEASILQFWGEHSELYGQWRYNGTPLKGHNGIDFALPAAAKLLAVDTGRVVEISIDRGGLERYIKVEHRWGESIYANLGEVVVESGKMVGRGDHLANTAIRPPTFLHFAIRLQPFNRHDGWGGFSDPLPYLAPGSLLLQDTQNSVDEIEGYLVHPMTEERPGMRRP